ncbi:RNA polymerase sigma factor [Microbacterium sp. ZW T5_56]|uniref:RNA polymerase sigma factor n=1 Tax=Microbacterium sp. ZW T5_56 TaxID=3378081 RepID=UPI00385233C3
MSRDDLRARIAAAAEREAPDLLAYFVRRVPAREDAADLLSETMLVLWRRARDAPSDDGQLRPWLFGVAHRVLQRHRRSWARREAATQRLRSELEGHSYSGFADSDDADRVRGALRVLAELDRQIITLVHWEGFTQAEAAAILGRNPSTVRTRYERARQRLRAVLADDDEHIVRVRRTQPSSGGTR